MWLSYLQRLHGLYSYTRSDTVQLYSSVYMPHNYWKASAAPVSGDDG